MSKNSIIIICLVASLNLMSSKTLAQGSNKLVDFIPKTPEAALYDTYGSIEANSNTGMPNISITLHKISIEGIELPITLSYLGNGIKVNDVATPVGLKWLLNCGGVISRDVIGLPDEINDWRKGWISMTGSYSLKLDNSTSACDPLYNTPFYNGEFDFSPDRFSYSIIGERGEFVFKRGGDLFQTVKSGNIIQPSFSSGLSNSYFDIKDTKGNLYTFNNIEHNTIQKTKASSGVSFNDNGGAPVVWKLSHIMNTYGKTISFQYLDYEYQTGWHTTGNEYVVDLNNNVVAPNTVYGLFTHSSNIITYSKLISEVESEYEKVVFEYSVDNTLAVMKKKLTKILVYDKSNLNHPKKTINFSYDKYSGDPRLKLIGIEICDENENAIQKYSFNYYNDGSPNVLPPLGAPCQDVFGYINSNTVQWMIPVFPSGSYQNSNREVDPNKISTGLLYELTYPTGGKARLSYEPNKYNNSGQVHYYPGVRVSNIKNFNKYGELLFEKQFEYGQAMSPQTRIYGTSFNNYVYNSLGSYLQLYSYIKYSSSPCGLGVLSPSISGFGYNNVKTIEIGNGYTIDYYDAVVDGYSYNFFPTKKEVYSLTEKVLEYQNHYTSSYEQEIYIYHLGESPYIFSGLINCGGTTWCSATGICPDTYELLYPNLTKTQSIQEKNILLQSKVQSELLNGKLVKTRQIYEYNQHQQIKQKEVHRLDELENIVDKKTSKYYYVTDPIINWLSMLTKDSLINKNFISTPLLLEDFNAFGQRFNGEKLYLNGKGQVVESRLWENYSPLGTGDYISYGVYNYSHLSSRILDLEIRGFNSGFVWGYNNRYPIVKAENATNSTLQTAVNASLPSGFSTLESLLLAISGPTDIRWVQFNTNLRAKSSLSSSQIYTYTYKQGIGMTSQTDPNGITTFYEYDGLGRLSVVRDHDENILKKYDYNYAE